jgi:protein O-mannosyl-transferase
MGQMRNPPPNPTDPRQAAEVGVSQAPPPDQSARPDALRALAAGLARFVRPASLLLLAVATLAVFSGALHADWVLMDDPEYVLTNTHINRGVTVQGLRWIMHSPHGANFHPLTSILHMADAQAFGLKAPRHHAVNVVFHVLNAILLAVALGRLTGSWWKSLLVAALFALHPLRVESVAWISELKDVLSGFFFMLVLWTYARWAERPGRGRFALVVVFLGLGLMAKSMLVTLPCVLVLLDVWPLGRLRGGPRAAAARRVPCAAPERNLVGLLVEKWPLFLLALAVAVLTFIVQRSSGAVAPTTDLTFASRVLNASLSYWRYLGLTVWPHNLLPLYMLSIPIHVVPGVVAALAVVGVTGIALWQGRRQPQFLVGWLWYVGTLVPVIGLVQVGMQSHADRYTYLTVIGALVAAVWTADEFWPRGRTSRILTALGVFAVLTALGVATTRQVARWKDNHTLFTYTLLHEPDNIMAHQCLGVESFTVGKYREAIVQFEAALKARPNSIDARQNLGNALCALGRYDEGIAMYRQVIRQRDHAELRHNIGLTLMKQGRTEEAIAEYQAGLKLDPDNFPTVAELAAALGSLGRLAESEPLLRHAVELDPKDATSRRLLAVALTGLGKVEEAIAQYRILANRDPDDLDALNNIAWIRATHVDPAYRNGAEAVQAAERARSRSKEPVAVLYSTLAAAYAEAGRYPDAVKAGVRATELARAEHDSAAGVRYAEQLAGYRAGRPFHFGQ